MRLAIIKTGGKQYKVSPGEILKIEKLPGNYKSGDTITFNEVLLLDDGKNIKLGAPYIKGASVEAIFEEIGKNKKISVIKFKRKTRYRKKYGHKQPHTKIKIK